MVSSNDLPYSCNLSYTTLSHINDFLVPYVSFKLLFCCVHTGQHFYLIYEEDGNFSSLIRFSYFLLMPSIYIYQNHLQLTCNANTSTTSFHFPIFTIPYVALHITLSISYLILPYAEISKRLLCDLLFTVACDNSLREEQFRL